MAKETARARAAPAHRHRGARARHRAGIADGGGLYAFIAAPGSGSWVYRYGGKNMGLGSMAIVSLAEARERARACRELRAAGVDPRAKREAERTAAKVAIAKAVTFDQAAAAYIKAHGPGWRNPKHRQQWANTLATYASPVIGGLPVGAVDVGLVLQILEPIWSTKPETAGRLRGRIEVILDWAQGARLSRRREPGTLEGPAGRAASQALQAPSRPASSRTALCRACRLHGRAAGASGHRRARARIHHPDRRPQRGDSWRDLRRDRLRRKALDGAGRADEGRARASRPARRPRTGDRQRDDGGGQGCRCRYQQRRRYSPAPADRCPTCR